MRRLTFALLLGSLLSAQEGQPPAPTPPSESSKPAGLEPQDELEMRRMQVQALQTALRLKEQEVVMLRAQVEMLRLDAALVAANADIDRREDQLRIKYGIGAGIRLQGDMTWKPPASR